jgi:hypothetical protein
MAGMVTGLVSMMSISDGSPNPDDDPIANGIILSTAIATAMFIIGVKLLRLVVHGPEMKKIATKITAAEGMYESSLQVLLVAYVIFSTGKVQWQSVSAIISSILMIGKSSAEAYLTFGQVNKMDCRLLAKLKMLAMFTPVFMLTAIFRIGTITLALIWDLGYVIIVIISVSLAAPFIFLLLL